MRLIAGEWGGRRLAVADVAGLRPSGDRVRETLFNWLQPHLGGARCLDLFAGSGALGLEAASRGAAAVTLIERDARACAALDDTLDILGAAPRVRLVRAAALTFLAGRVRDRDARPEPPFDVVFVDPPFDAASQIEVLAALVEGAHLAAGARVYVEAPSRQPWPDSLPGSLGIERERRFGDVAARLLRLAPPSAPGTSP